MKKIHFNSVDELKNHFLEAREHVRSIGLTSTKEWKEWAKKSRPDFIPSNPDVRFRSVGWVSWSDWLGNEPLTFNKARSIVHELGLKSMTEWYKYWEDAEGSLNIPKYPQRVYKEDFLNVKDWLGLPNFLPFEEAREYVHALNLSGQIEWRKIAPSLPPFIPKNPRVHYANKWKGYGDWTGSNNLRTSKGKSEWLQYEEAAKFTRTLGLKSVQEWRAYLRGDFKDKEPLPYGVPKSPQYVYGEEFKGYHDWLGSNPRTTARRDAKVFDFDKSIEFISTLNLKNVAEWKEYITGKLHHLPTIPEYVPKNPRRAFPDKWNGWENWLGVDVLKVNRKSFLPFNEAKELVQKLSLTKRSDWTELIKTVGLPDGVPRSPRSAYGNQWVGWGDWLGYDGSGNIFQKREYLSFDQAKEFMKNVGLSNSIEWRIWSKTKRPSNIPSEPSKHYREHWIGLADFLGYEEPSRNVSPAVEIFSTILTLKEQIQTIGENDYKEVANEIKAILAMLE